MYPDPTTQTETHNEDEEQDRNDDEMKGNNMTEEVVNEEADQGEVIEEATNKVQQNDAEENDEDMFEEEDMDEQVRSVPHFKNIEMESEQDELEEDDDDDNNNIKNICTVRGSTQDDEDASVPTRNNADHNSSSTFKRNTPEDEPNRDAESPPIKRPRVIPATQTDNGSVLDYDSDELESVITSARQTSNRFISSFQSVSGVPERFQSTITAQYSTLDDEIATPDMNESQPENTDQDAHTSDIPPPSSPQNPLDENLPGENQASERQSNVDLVDENQPSEHPASERQPSINPADDRQSGVNPEDEYQSSENSTDEYQPSETPADQPNVNPADEHQLDENSPDEHRESEKLPHGLPHTINEGPAEGFSDYSDSDGDYQDALQSTEPELSHSVASAPVRPPRADLPFRGTAGQTATETETTTTTATATNTVQATSNNTISRQSNGNTRNRAPDRGYNPWTSEELEALENGIGAFGTRWVAIKERYKETLRARTNVQLKDKARNELKFRKLAGEPLGVYECLDRQVQFSGEQSTRRTNRRALIKRRREAGEVE
ncbi:hypothetical protein BDA99DRAFT_252296 [Phascolomyces articulosus]|uniref:Myb-like domain-containing protein n=1 Tax=Phascolomyces articulosus TaxID=60185 RepID=A0AAD5P8Q5_9FUNG|nr:hypothetical protein BDA99DRAFT_252296 [Phascolomyces articulosus]